jgi:hypothetical protein
MAKTNKIPMTEQQQGSMSANKEIRENFELQKKLQKQYTQLKTNLEAIREAKPTDYDNKKLKESLLHWETMVDHNQNKLQSLKDDLEAKRNALEQKYANWIKAAEKSYATHKKRYEEAQETLKRGRKTKEEIKLEKQIYQILVEFKKIHPDKDIEFHFPNFKNCVANPIVIEPEPEPEPEPAPVPAPVIEEEEEVQDEKPWSEMTPWERYLKANPGKSLYNAYHGAIDSGITPDIPEPAKPVPKRRAKTTTETISRQDLSKILPNYA